MGKIASFLDRETEKIYKGEFSKKLPQQIQKIAFRKLILIDSVEQIDDLREPPGNHFEQLKGSGLPWQYSIRINKQYRIRFSYINNRFENVQIIDYHD